MQVKIDTKEKFHVITLTEQILSATLAESLYNQLTNFLQTQIKNVILKLPNVQDMSEEVATSLCKIQERFYENSASLVLCEIHPDLEKKLDEMDLLELLNITPTESEAWDIVQMEEIERELMDDDEGVFPTKND